jgi:hypothetical protein
MRWIKDVLVDIVVTIVLIIATFGGFEWARWAITIYTPFILLLLLVQYLQRHTLSKFKPKKTSAPDYAYHVLYGANVLIASYGRWWWVAGCWIAIWILSTLTAKSKAAKK